jgi:ribosomal protection tetracycline resistance protein
MNSGQLRPSATLNLGILAHVDAGKTSLTERLLFHHGVIRKLGSVDTGDTTTDSDDLERERGITIRSAVTGFNVCDLRVNLVDTPGHPDFIAEVERALGVLDGVVLVLSAVEGIQAQTKVLMRTLQKLSMPTVFFINKIDRMGARGAELVAAMRLRLAENILVMNQVDDIGSPKAEVVSDALSERAFTTEMADQIITADDQLLERLAEGREITFNHLTKSLADQTRSARVHPLFFGSAIKGMGIDPLVAGIRMFLPSTPIARPDNVRAVGSVFAVERSQIGDKVALLRVVRGTLRERELLKYAQQEASGQVGEHEERITSLERIGDLPGIVSENTGCATAGDIVRLRGLSHVRVGAQLGGSEEYQVNRLFRPPGLQTVVRPKTPKDKARLFSAICELSDQDPLIQAQVTEDGGLSIKLYGEVQKEVIRDRLQRHYNVDPEFLETQVVYFERPIGCGSAEWVYDRIYVRENIFPIDLAFRVEGGKIGQGNAYVREAQWGLMPAGFYRAIEESALTTLAQGLHGWEVTDCVVTLTKVAYERPLTVAAHFRHLTAILVMRALRQANVQVIEPYSTFELEAPNSVQGMLVGLLGGMGADIRGTEQLGELACLISGTLPARSVQELARELPGLTNGDGVLSVTPGYGQPVRGTPPSRPRTDGNPLDFDVYLKYLEKHKLLSSRA